jgi:heme-degrading monooxygenase HmoA
MAHAQSLVTNNIETDAPLIISINVHVKQEFQKQYIEWYQIQQTKHKLDGVVFSYLEKPIDDEKGTFKSVTIWKSKSAYVDYMKNIKGDRAAADLDETRKSASVMLSAPPEYLITRPVAYSR